MEFRRVDVIWKGESAITEDYAFRPSRQSIMFSSQWNPPCILGSGFCYSSAGRISGRRGSHCALQAILRAKLRLRSPPWANSRRMKPPPDVVFHRDERVVVWIPHGVMDAQRIDQLINALAHEEALAKTYFHRFSGLLIC